MRRMGMMQRQKELWLDDCAFCTTAEITDRVTCGLGKNSDAIAGDCDCYAPVKDDSARIKILFERLPEGYGFAERFPEIRSAATTEVTTNE